MMEFRFTQMEMQQAVQHYLNTVVLKDCVKVNSVEYNSNGPQTNSFTIKTNALDIVDDEGPS